jgi:protein-S-isoprenylcysteine O-methyltransferase
MQQTYFPRFGMLWIDGLWLAFVAIWVIGAAKIKRAERRVAGWPRWVQIGLTAAGAVLLFDPAMDAGILGFRCLPLSAVFGGLGGAITASGLAFAVWARFVLGRNWSSQITLKQEHELIQSGPYRLVRHPIYSGILLALLGTAIYIGELRGFIAFPLFAAGWRLKARVEESLMLEHFGEQYRDYQRKVKAIVPFVV